MPRNHTASQRAGARVGASRRGIAMAKTGAQDGRPAPMQTTFTYPVDGELELEITVSVKPFKLAAAMVGGGGTRPREQ